MSAKSATNNGKVNGETIAPPAAPEKPKPASVVTRVKQLEDDVEILKAELSRATKLLVNMVTNQTVQATLPAVEQQLRGQIAQQYEQGGLAALLGETAVPQPEQSTPAP